MSLVFDRSILTLCWWWRQEWQDVISCFSMQPVYPRVFVRAGMTGPLLGCLDVCPSYFTWSFWKVTVRAWVCRVFLFYFLHIKTKSLFISLLLGIYLALPHLVHTCKAKCDFYKFLIRCCNSFIHRRALRHWSIKYPSSVSNCVKK